ncbi:DUF2938 family protein [Enterobacteriaceae bacterium EKM102V]|nr:DUF2938 family protein [Enterobacteriaceae bacterium EKM102V]KAF6669993.1 DUF2938 family protein [Pantoea sp. EKM103V]
MCHKKVFSTSGLCDGQVVTRIKTGQIFCGVNATGESNENKGRHPGIIFAFIPLVLDGSAWFHDPSFRTALLTGLLTLSAPFIVLQPALSFGFAASRTPRPWRARLLSLLTHIAYGCGLSITTLLTY